MDCRIAIAQTNPRLGDLHSNLGDHVEAIEAAADSVDLILFPELSLTGYFLKDQVFELGLTRDSREIRELCELSGRVSIGLGFVERAADGRLYNAFAFLEDGEVLGVHRKVHLVSYGVFDEGRDFAAGEGFELIESKHGRFGPLICEDAWHVPSAYIHFLNGADALLVTSASPARGVEAPGPGLGSQRSWDTLLCATALFFRTWLVYASRVGWEDGVAFSGGSCIIDPFGVRTEALEGIEGGLLRGRLTSAVLDRARVETPLRRDEKPWILLGELARHVPLPPPSERGR